MSLRHTTIRRDSTGSSSAFSDYSDRSRSTAPTVYSERHYAKPSVDIEYPLEECEDDWQGYEYVEGDDRRCSNASIETYASTIPSEEGLEVDDYPQYEEPEYQPAFYAPPTALASTPQDFAELFPSSRRLCIRHDDTVDGNMNLRVDTGIVVQGRKLDLTLFHLRMHDLKNRDFSLRRYCRASGREICHTSRKYTKPAADRKSAFQRSMLNALSSLKSPSSNKLSHETSSKPSLSRTGSNYSHGSHEDEFEASEQTSPHFSSIPRPTNTTKLEFSSYAHVDLRRRGTKANKRYEFNYWGKSYTWKVQAAKIGQRREISYHLHSSEGGSPIAHIVPDPMSPSEIAEEEAKGGWVPQSSMWISDDKTILSAADIADTIIASGLLVLVDDSIKRRWHAKDRFSLHVPTPVLPSGKVNMHYVSPKVLMDGLFNRRQGVSVKASPLRQNFVKP